jgi:hypothetical protein
MKALGERLQEMRMPRMCAFCPRDAVEKGGEHIFEDWINKALPPVLYLSRTRYTKDSPTIESTTTSLSDKLPVVCAACNNGWMSVLSLKVKDRFSRAMLDGEPFSLGARDAAILATFTFMKAVVTNHFTSYCHGADPFFARAVRERFGTSLVLPPLTQAWIAAFQAESFMSTYNRLSVVSPSGGPLFGTQFCSFTYIVGKLTLQLLAPGWKNIRDRGKPLPCLDPSARWNEAQVLFWPHTGTSLSWPPPKHIGHDMIEAYITRFQNPVSLPIS